MFEFGIFLKDVFVFEIVIDKVLNFFFIVVFVSVDMYGGVVFDVCK